MNPSSLLQEILILTPPFLLALTVHEFAHGYVAHQLGDPTASRLGRLTLNPLKHLDPIGVLCFFIMKIGWAKPVPVNPRYFRNPLRDMVWVALAGAGANLLLAVACSIILKLLALAHLLRPGIIPLPLLEVLAAAVWINIMLAVFNLIPIPPLDGSKVLMGLLPRDQAEMFRAIEPYGFIILLALFYIGFIPKIIVPIINFANALIVG